MADASHLERMGRELKCPICLSLFDSAVSLTCNHVFCNSCIEKSMKATSSCPVCKVPYRRREIRPAPHMDNLVSVYKSMEAASGVNIFITQTAATKLSGEENQTEVDMYEIQHNGQTKEEALNGRNPKQHRRERPKSASLTSQRSSGSNSVKPSFPIKKRIQVPRYTTSGTEIEHKVLEARTCEIDRNESKSCSVSQKDMPITCKQGEPILTPFFWLREEEDLEKLSQQTVDNQIMYTPPDVPCFSDIKDSDDEARCQTTPERGTRILPNNADFIDSEMFDWTQRPCSPELCSSPQVLQIEHITVENLVPDKAEAGVKETIGVRSNIKGSVMRKEKTSDSTGGTRKSKKASVAKEARKNKRTNKTGEVIPVVQQGNKESPLDFKRTSRKSKKVLSDVASVGEKNVLNLCVAENLVNNSNTFAQVLDSEDIAKEPRKNKRTNKTGEVIPVVQEGNKESPLDFKQTSRKSKKVLSDVASVGEKNVLNLCDVAENLVNNSNTFAQVLDSEDIAKEPRKNKRTNKTGEVIPVVQEGNKESPLYFKRTSRKSKKVLSDAASVGEKNVLNPCDVAENLANNSNTFAQVLDSEDLGKSSEGGGNLKKRGKSNKRAKKALAQPQKFSSDVITQRAETERGCSSKEARNEGLISQSHTDLPPLCNEKEVSFRCTKRTYKENRDMPKSLKKVKFSIEGMPKDNYVASVNDEDARIDQSIDDIRGARAQLQPEAPGKVDKVISSPIGYVLHKCNTSLGKIRCAFCQSFEVSEASGIMVHYLKGKLVADDHDAIKNAIHVHKSCAEWAPNVYFEGDDVVNLDTELSRSRRIRCCCCGIKGAALGCYEKSCRRSFHVPCASLPPECRWDSENFVILCPIHSSLQLPNEVPQSRKKRKSSAETSHEVSQSGKKRKTSDERKSCTIQKHLRATDKCKSNSDMQWKSPKKLKNLVLCCSALTNTEKEIVTEFENLSGVTILKNWKSMVTHVIASTDENGACRRTLKFLMGILEGKWILSVQWIKACIEAGDLVDEQQYEISVDIHGIRDGPKLGRLRLLNKQPKLFDGQTFYFMGDFTPSYKGYLHDLVVAAGGKVLNRKPVVGESSKTVIIYSIELPEGNSDLNDRRRQAEALATSAGAVVASNSWIMNSIAGYKLLRIGE